MSAQNIINDIQAELIGLYVADRLTCSLAGT